MTATPNGIDAEVGARAAGFGELDTQVNLDVIEHLNMCPACTRRVNAQHQLKAAVSRMADGIEAPDRLAGAIRAKTSAMLVSSGIGAEEDGRSLPDSFSGGPSMSRP